MAELLLELLSEEIPARMQARAAEDLKRLVCDRLDKAQLTYARAEAFVTPRRLALVVQGLPEKQPDIVNERKGPRVGSPDKALQGFLQAAGLASLEEAEVRETAKGSFYFATPTRPGAATPDIISGVLGEVISSFPWPKSMRWGSGAVRWVRPLQNIVALFEGAPVPFELTLANDDPLSANMQTAGHRFLAPQWFEVRDFADYRAKLRDAKVVLDPAERRRLIQEEARRLAAAEGLRLREDEGLLDEVSGLVEWPVLMLGRIDPKFMEVPPEVLVTAMRTHQKYFSLLDAEGRLAPRFVLVANTEAADGGKAIVAGNERVLRARLSDAKFFWDEDRKRPLESRVPKLAERVFHAKLGSDKQRAGRLESLAPIVAGHLKDHRPNLPIYDLIHSGSDFQETHPDLLSNSARAALLCKSDLTSLVVGEFPELQGVMGGHYALHDGEPAEVADAIAEHYSPQGPSDRCPRAPVSVAVALADKIDTLVGFFAIGEQPTGSRDPFALRRACLGAIRIILENSLKLRLREVLKEAYWLYFFQISLDDVTELRIASQQWDVKLDSLCQLVSRGFYVHFLRRDAKIASFLDDLVSRKRDLRLAEFRSFADAVSKHANVLQGITVMLPKAQDDPSTRADKRDAFRQYLDQTPEIASIASVLADDLLAFFADRLKVHLREQGVRHDLIAAVFAGGAEDDIVRLLARVDALRDFLSTEDGANLLVAYRRASNIVRIEENKDGTVYNGEADGRLLEEQQEIDLYRSLAEARAGIGRALSGERFGEAMSALAELRAPVDAFFDHVTVNCTNSRLRINRLRLLSQIRSALEGVADFSQIEG